MQILVFIQCRGLSFLSGLALSITALPFNPVRMLLLIGWVYLCLYFVQRAQFSPLIPRRYKSPANVVTLFLGPLLLFVLLVIDVIRKSSENRNSIFAVIKEWVTNIIGSIKSGNFKPRSPTDIKILDSAGRSLNEIYGHGKIKRQDSHILDLTEQIIADALEERASDILIDPKEDSTYAVRLRIDGVLTTVQEIGAEICHAIINSLKAVSGMDIAEKRRPQDGAFTAKKGDDTASFRIASAGVLNGEKLSIRVLNRQAGMFTLADVGLSKKQYEIVKSFIDKPSGMILVCGPTGSGKTTTLYGMLNEIDRFTRNVITIEDPIEAQLPNASQIEINPKADITFAKTLRSVLRQDPDVICVGEIRDEETAAMALRASQTGHVVLATIHSNSNASALVRLLDLGISPILMSSGLSLVVSQRLLRVLCNHCKKHAEFDQSQILEFHRQGANYKNIYRPVGCKKCRGTGYYGRTAVFDLLVLDDRSKAAIANSESLINQLRSDGDKKGASNLYKQGFKNVALGITGLEELKRVVG